MKQLLNEICYGEGVSKLGEIIDLGVEYDIIEKSGSWYSYNSQRIGQGKENIKEFLKNNKEMCDEIESKIREKLKSSPAKLVVGGEVEEDNIESEN